MGKYGKFIGKNFLELNDSDINNLNNHIKQISDRFNNLGLNNTIETKLSKLCDGDVYHININIDEIYKRNSQRDMVRINGISLMFIKQSGYIEDGSISPEYQYSLNISLKGNIRYYRHKNWTSENLKGNYQYGTEMEDLDLSESLMSFERLIS